MQSSSGLLRPQLPISKGRFLVGLALLFALIIMWHTIVFADQNYRQDEINTVHAAYALDYAGVANWLLHEGTHPIGWRLFAIEWIRFFGMAESVTRFMSVLFTLVTLAGLYRLGKQLFDYKVGVISVITFGFMFFTAWHTHELRPYAPLMAIATWLAIFYLRWLKNQNFTNALVVVVLGGVGLQVHFYSALQMTMLFLFTLIIVNWDWVTILRSIGLFAAVGLSFSWWLPALYYGAFLSRESGISYALASDLQIFLSVHALTMGFPLLSLGIFLPLKKYYPHVVKNLSAFDYKFRYPIHWRQLYLLFLGGGTFVIAWTLNYFVSSFGFRNLLIMMPFYCLTLGYMIGIQKPRFRNLTIVWFVALWIIVGFTGVFRMYDNIPLHEMYDYINQSFDEDTALITEVNMTNRSSETIVYYMMDRLPVRPSTEDIYSIAEPQFMDEEFFVYTIERSLNRADDTDTETLHQFEEFLSQYDHLWYIEYVGLPLFDNRPVGDAFRSILERNFTVISQKTFKADDVLEFEVKEYRRVSNKPLPIIGGALLPNHRYHFSQ